jgi:chromosome segregation ATPase
MSTEQNPKPATTEEKPQKEKEIKITVDNKETQRLAEELARAETEKKAMEEKLAKMEAEHKTQEEASKKLTEEAEDLKNKLGIIAEKELEKKRKIVSEKANSLLKDPDRVKEIEAKLSTPEGVAAMEYTMNVLEKQMKIGQEQFEKYKADELKKAEEAAKLAAAKSEEEKKKIEAELKAAEEAKKAAEKQSPTGAAPLNAAQMGEGGEQLTGMMQMKFGSYEAMVRYLHEIEQGPDKQKAAEAKAALTELLRKWASLVKQNYDSMRSAPPEGFKDAPLFKDILKSKRAEEELRRRQQGGQPENVVTG